MKFWELDFLKDDDDSLLVSHRACVSIWSFGAPALTTQLLAHLSSQIQADWGDDWVPAPECVAAERWKWRQDWNSSIDWRQGEGYARTGCYSFRYVGSCHFAMHLNCVIVGSVVCRSWTWCLCLRYNRGLSLLGENHWFRIICVTPFVFISRCTDNCFKRKQSSPTHSALYWSTCPRTPLLMVRMVIPCLSLPGGLYLPWIQQMGRTKCPSALRCLLLSTSMSEEHNINLIQIRGKVINPSNVSLSWNQYQQILDTL